VHGALVGAWSGQYNEEVANSVVLVLWNTLKSDFQMRNMCIHSKLLPQAKQQLLQFVWKITSVAGNFVLPWNA
jgi:hypothetical protein